MFIKECVKKIFRNSSNFGGDTDVMLDADSATVFKIITPSQGCSRKEKESTGTILKLGPKNW